MNPSKSFYYGLLLAGISLGTAWAIRGQFGHEHGAAWAGGIGSLAIILLAKRPEWYPKALKATVAGAIGWGLGGIMSYGMVVGYGRGSDFGNVYYGLAMLFVIGGLYGFLGGGLFGLALSDSKDKPVSWASLLVEMVVMAVVFYFFIIEQFAWLMTPPRSELWAACLGMAVALAWYLVRNGHPAALRVAVYAGLGGGFGFAFGNFLQVLGRVSEIDFNFWNVMEYTLGFCGGIGMAYGTFTADWTPAAPVEVPKRNWFPIVMLTLVIPLIVWDQNFETERLSKMLEPLISMNIESATQLTQTLSFLAIACAGLYWVFTFYLANPPLPLTYLNLRNFFLAHFALYTLCSFLITGAFLSTYRIEQYLYVINLLIVGLLIGKVKAEFFSQPNAPRQWGTLLAGVLVFMAVLAIIAIASHGELKGAQVRF
ncbi:hypothetical protein [Salmonirosea aquatica]|uniref:DUF3464 family protein n=1 Tax=Salmonirosea aquatica TaxID=2654236 RepID=A0A7C9BDL2_9BACT|nr:hypothetical protein [Cytophagaceae bacterium SJW1-29]